MRVAFVLLCELNAAVEWSICCFLSLRHWVQRSRAVWNRSCLADSGGDLLALWLSDGSAFHKEI